jgi:hypothetical protein
MTTLPAWLACFWNRRRDPNIPPFRSWVFRPEFT